MLLDIYKKISFKEIFSLFLILELSLYTWLPLTRSAIRGLGFMYLRNSYQAEYWQHLEHFGSFDWFAVVTGIFFSKFYGVNLSLYFWTELFLMLIIDVFFFYFVLILTKKLIVAFSATLMLSVNYFGGFGLLSGGLFAYFQERIPVMLLLIPSLIFLHLYLKKSQKKYYIWSLVLFFLGIGLQHWGVLFTSPYFIYPFFHYLFDKKNKKSSLLMQSILVGLSYIIISGFFVSIQYFSAGDVGPRWSFIQFLTNPQIYHYPENMLRQLIYWSSYLPFAEYLKGGYPLNPSTPLYFFITPEKSLLYGPYVIVAYLIATATIYWRLPKFRAILLTIIFGVAAIFYLNAYFGEYNVPTQAGTNRYLYLPTYLLVIYWSLFLWAIFWKGGGKKILIGLAIVGLYYILNTWLIRDNFKWQFNTNNITLQIWQRIVNTRSYLNEKTLIVLPAEYVDSYMLVFLNEQLGKETVSYTMDVESWQKNISNYPSIIKLEYNTACQCITEKKIIQPELKKNGS